jgi:uncharacterized protein YbaP (TraB family)
MRFLRISEATRSSRFAWFVTIVMSLELGCIHTADDSGAMNAKPESLSSNAPIKAPLLWRLTHKENSCYLLGTIHVGVDAQKELPTAVWRAFEAVNHFIVEHDLKSFNIIHPPNRISGTDMLSQSLSETAWDNLQAALPNIDPKDLESFPAGIAAMNYQLALLAQVLPLDPPQMDRDLAIKATERDLKFSFLESPEEAFAAASQTISSISELEAMLVRDRKEFQQELLSQIAELIKTYRSGDLRKLEDQTMDQMPMRIYEVLVAQRNNRWSKSLAQFVQRGNCFIAVGAAHMIGQDSLLSLLEDEGIKIERIEP